MAEAYYKSASESDWHKITASAPITYTQKQDPSLFNGGQCPIAYGVYIEWKEWASSSEPTFVNRSSNSPVWGPINVRTLVTGSYTTWWGQPYKTIQILLSSYGPAQSARRTSPVESSVRHAVETTIVNIIPTPLGGQLDNCGNPPAGQCVTTFSSGGQVIKTLSASVCHSVKTDGSPADCQCCKDLLPKASRILTRLSK